MGLLVDRRQANIYADRTVKRRGSNTFRRRAGDVDTFMSIHTVRV